MSLLQVSFCMHRSLVFSLVFVCFNLPCLFWSLLQVFFGIYRSLMRSLVVCIGILHSVSFLNVYFSLFALVSFAGLFLYL